MSNEFMQVHGTILAPTDPWTKISSRPPGLLTLIIMTNAMNHDQPIPNTYFKNLVVEMCGQCAYLNISFFFPAIHD